MEAIQSFDFTILNAIQDSLRCAFLDGFAVFLSYITTSGIIWIAIAVILLFFRKTRAAGILLLGALALSFLTSELLLKLLIQRPRPFVVNPNITLLITPPTGTSFPSSHSCLAAASATVLLVKKRWLGVIALIMTLCIAFSRLYLYFHFPSDVLCGLLLGVICALIMLWIGKITHLDNRLSKKS
ncbi:MAG: phosphatase PAP2 family protein [Ruminococcus sp.]|nr:phosphatase PAP2 family protein [Ruminococcus sp.]